MTLNKCDETVDWVEQLEFGKTCPASSTPKTMPLDAFWEHLPAKLCQSNRQGKDGATLVMSLAPKEQSRGGYSMPNISEWPNAAAVCLLSHVLEATSVQEKYFLSAKACAGIMRRAEKRGKKLPPQLQAALQSRSRPPLLRCAAEAETAARATWVKRKPPTP